MSEERNLNTPNPWQTTPRKSIIVFLFAVFLIFASFGLANDVIDMGLQRPLRFGISVVLFGLFALLYAVAGITLRGQFWKACLPIFVLQAIVLGLLNNWLPEAPRPAQLNPGEMARLEHRLLFDGLAIMASICLGYTGFVYVSISEGRRHGRAQMEKATLESEMSAAREIQRVIVPQDLPRIEGYAIESVYRPAAEVGGDFFQVIPLKRGRTLVVIGDVSGKGLRAAMIVSMIVGALRTVCSFTEEPAEILGELNRRLCGHMQEGFATCLALRLEENGRLTLANAGHIPPYLNGLEVQFPGSLPLGLAESSVYDQTGFGTAVGDAIMMMTDGIAEARSEQGVLLGFVRVEAMLQTGASAASVAEAAQQHGQNDDITVLQVARLES